MASVTTGRVTGHAIRPAEHVEGGRGRAYVAAPNGKETSPLARNADFPRSASYTYLPGAKENTALVTTIKGSFSEADLGDPSDEQDTSPPDSSGWTTPEEFIEHKVPVTDAAALIAELQKSPKIRVHGRVGATEDNDSSAHSSVRRGSTANTSLDTLRTTSTPATTPGSVTPRARQSVNSSFSRRLNRRTWYGASQPSTPSRSPSPAKEKATRPNEGGGDGVPIPLLAGALSRKKSSTRRKESYKQSKSTKEMTVGKGDLSSSPEKHAPERPVTRRSTLLRRKTRPISQLFQNGKESMASTEAEIPDVPAIPKLPILPKSFSTERLPTFRSQTSQGNDRAAPMPRLLSSERVPSAGMGIPTRKKDELWSVFRNLEGEYAKFASKSVAFKANVVRSSLLPFLRIYATHTSNKTLRPEDLDRRANILNKWWTGLVELLHGRNNQSISGTDRPAILDGISGIMERAEWRLPPSPFCPLNQRLRGSDTPRDRSATSLSSSASEFLTESVHHNVRNIFIQNLSAQMAFVVDKMSLRHASASLVTFCGKACAYAFVFVPGMADVLVRLWDLQTDTLRRVLEENGVGKFDDLTDVPMSVLSSFPPALQQLGFMSLTTFMRKLRTPPPLPLGTANIQWWGHWLDRWSGRESDLFYVFVKHFYILATDFLPSDTTRHERLCAPGLLPVQAQLLANLDATIHRNVNQSHRDLMCVGTSPTFDDVLADPDAGASALPLPPTNAVRVMAENRLIMLIRDILSERMAEHPKARQLFAQSFNDLLQTATKGTSIFDHAACYTLLDFLEEALTLLVRYENMYETTTALISSAFWQTVFTKMISSHNTMTEIRLYAFLYSIWNAFVSDAKRKQDLCMGFLLHPDIFESRFNHWCPMVRAYFMRLLCWRIGRYDGDARPDDVRIFETMLERLQSNWAYYLYLREEAERNRSLPPSTNPCNPAPNRRLLIIRTDMPLSPGHSFFSFDGLASRDMPLNRSQLHPKRFPPISPVGEMGIRPETSRASSDSEQADHRGRGIGGFIRKMIGSSRSRSKSQSRSSQPKQENTPPPLPIGPPTGLMRSATDDIQSSHARVPVLALAMPAPANSHRNFCFKFSLEFHSSKATPGPMRLHPPRLPAPAQLLLQQYPGKADSAKCMTAMEPKGASRAYARYCGRALAEWAVVVGECQSFFDRRKSEGVPSNKHVETPTLGVEVFKRPS